jgi:hypothetical protein
MSTPSSSTLPIGEIIGGVLGTIVVIAAMIILAWYKFKTKQRVPGLKMDNENFNQYPQEQKTHLYSAENTNNMEVRNAQSATGQSGPEMPGSPEVRYMNSVSGNLAREY